MHEILSWVFKKKSLYLKIKLSPLTSVVDHLIWKYSALAFFGASKNVNLYAVWHFLYPEYICGIALFVSWVCAKWHFPCPEYAKNNTFRTLSMRGKTLSVPWVCAEWSLAQCWVCAELWKLSHRWQKQFFLETFKKTRDGSSIFEINYVSFICTFYVSASLFMNSRVLRGCLRL